MMMALIIFPVKDKPKDDANELNNITRNLSPENVSPNDALEGIS